MFTQTPELQKADEEEMGSSTSNNAAAPIIFSASSGFNTSSSVASGSRIDQRASQIDSRDVKAFLRLVAEGEQDQAEELLKKTPDLVLASGDVTDLSGRTFKGITGFQYSIWALDWHMWSMIQKYLPNDAAAGQIQRMESGAWVKQHGKKVSWINFLTALDDQIALLNAKKWDESYIQWQKQVGTAQRLLPSHVVNEYCRPDRPFEPCPNFLEVSLPRTRKTDKGEWYTASYNEGKLGEKFAYMRAAWGEAVWAHGDTLYGLVTYVMQDRTACHTLLVTRTQQCDQLLTQYSKTNQVGTEPPVFFDEPEIDNQKTTCLLM